MRKQKLTGSKNISDKDFIFDVFRNKGFVLNANNFLQSTAKHEPIPQDIESDTLIEQKTDH